MGKHFCFNTVGIIVFLLCFVAVYALFYFIIPFCIIEIDPFIGTKKRMANTCNTSLIETKSKYITYAFIQPIYNILYFCFCISIRSIYL